MPRGKTSVLQGGLGAEGLRRHVRVEGEKICVKARGVRRVVVLFCVKMCLSLPCKFNVTPVLQGW